MIAARERPGAWWALAGLDGALSIGSAAEGRTAAAAVVAVAAGLCAVRAYRGGTLLLHVIMLLAFIAQIIVSLDATPVLG